MILSLLFSQTLLSAMLLLTLQHHFWNKCFGLAIAVIIVNKHSAQHIETAESSSLVLCIHSTCTRCLLPQPPWRRGGLLICSWIIKFKSEPCGAENIPRTYCFSLNSRIAVWPILSVKWDGKRLQLSCGRTLHSFLERLEPSLRVRGGDHPGTESFRKSVEPCGV